MLAFYAIFLPGCLGVRRTRRIQCGSLTSFELGYLRERSMESKKSHTCRRCYSKEYIPTHQYVKFDMKVHYLCRRCWEDYRSWFFWGQRPAPQEVGESTTK